MIITKGKLVEQVELGNLLLLLETIQQKEDLSLKGVFLPILIKVREERVVIRFFQNTPGIKFLS
jgi:hypothetical protein